MLEFTSFLNFMYKMYTKIYNFMYKMYTKIIDTSCQVVRPQLPKLVSR